MVRMTSDQIADGTLGFCRSCNAEVEGVEPDARNYHCDRCGADEVFGAEELVAMGEVEMIDDDDDGVNGIEDVDDDDGMDDAEDVA